MSAQPAPTPPADFAAEPTPVEPRDTTEPNTQGNPYFRANWPEWVQELPVLRFKPEEPNIHAPLIDPTALEQVLAGTDPALVQRIRDDIKFLDYELLRLFRMRDHEAKKQQNRYRKYQLGYLVLAAIATAIGSAQALALATDARLMPWFAFGETLVALLATFLVTLGSREAPLPRWMDNRRRAEQLRREYFAYLMNLPPYDTVYGYERKLMLSRRAADINRGIFPPEGYDTR